MRAVWRRSLWVVLVVASLSLIVRATLFPTSDPDTGTFHWCLLCGDFGLSDIIANLILFMPAAFALYGAGWPVRRVVSSLCALSAAIELAQLWIPGRESALGDIISNTLGATAGVGLSWWWSRRRRTPAGAAALAVAALAVIAGAGIVLRPSFPATVYYGQWTAELGQFDTYHGRVVSADIGGMELPSWKLQDSRTVRARLADGDLLVVRAVAGPAPRHLAPLFSIADDLEQGILLTGVDREDLVLTVRTRAADLRLRQMELRWPQAMAAVGPGDSFSVAVWRVGKKYCLRLNNRSRCGLTYATDQVWSLIASLPGRLAGWETVAGCVFVALLGFPVGLLAPRRPPGWIAVGVLLWGVAFVPPAVGLAPFSVVDAAVLLLSIAAGMLVPMGGSDADHAREGTLPV